MGKTALETLFMIIWTLLSIGCDFSCPDRFQRGRIVRTYDRSCVNHKEGVIPIDHEEHTIFLPSDSTNTHKQVYLMPDRHVFWALSQYLDVSPQWLSLKDSIDYWFQTIPFDTEVQGRAAQKSLSIEYQIQALDTVLIGKEIYEMLVGDYLSGEWSSDIKLFWITNLRRYEDNGQ